MKQKIKALILVVFAISLIFPKTVFASSLSALDTVSGFETMLKASGLPSAKKITFRVSKPDGTIFSLGAEADSEGNASVLLPDTQTREAGTYLLTTDVFLQTAKFQVFPGDPSADRSGMYANKVSIPANGVDMAQVTVRIVDFFSNPIEFHEIKLLSDRSDDRIISASAETNKQGLASFYISSPRPGTSTLIATDETADLTLSSRLKITFSPSSAVFKAVGGDPETILLAASHGPVTRFEIENLAASVTQNEAVSFTVNAVEADGATVPGYRGVILFRSTDPNAILPVPYTFEAADQGKKTFNLGLTFKGVGSQKIIIEEQGNTLVKGEKTVEVTATAVNAGTGQVKITKPATGTYSVKTLSVEGEATANAKVQIFDKGQQIAEVPANSSGRFSFTTSLLSDGVHTFHAESNGVQSSPVSVTIDTTPAEVEQADISNKELAPGDTTELTVRTDPTINSIQATVGDFIIDLEADPQNPGLFRGVLTAPASDGEFPVNVIITDKQGNVSPPKEVGRVTVNASLQNIASFSVPSQVASVSATAGNGKVTFTWTPASAENGIVLYRFYYGADPEKLTLIANTPDANTSFKISNLQNGTQYFFQIVGVDSLGNEGDNRSDTVSATPLETLGEPDLPVLCDPSPCPEAGFPPFTPEDGPGVIGILFAALGGGLVYRKFRK